MAQQGVDVALLGCPLVRPDSRLCRRTWLRICAVKQSSFAQSRC